MNLANKRIAFLYPQPGFTSNPTLMTCAQRLMAIDAKVIVYSLRDDDAGTVPGVEHRPFPLLWKWRHGSPFATMRYWSQWVISRWDIIRNRSLYKQLDLLVGINSEGIIQAMNLSRLSSKPIVYFSFEIFFRDEMKRVAEIREKEFEVSASKRAAWILVQDTLRGIELARENSIDPKCMFHVPVALGGNAQVLHSQWLRKRLNLSPDKIIILHSGAFCHWTYAQELLESTSNWPDHLILVVHTKYPPKSQDRFVNMIQSGNYPRVVLHTEHLQEDEYEQMIASADIGLALYKSTPPSRYEQKNLLYIGLSSGKFSAYAKQGLPIISVAQACYKDLFKIYDCGADLDGFANLPHAVSVIQARREFHRAEARRLFNEKLSFDLYWPEMARRFYSTIHSDLV